MRWQFGNRMHWRYHSEHMRVWAKQTFIVDIEGIYTPRLGGWM